MASNGNLPNSALSPIAGGGRLANDAAAGWNALAVHVYKQTGHKIRASEGYRTLDRQNYFWDLYQSGQGNLAAYPGTSNHGLGIAVDLASQTDRSMIDSYGERFGWSKSWSDAPGEWWHIKFAPGHYSGDNPGPKYGRDPITEKLKRKVERVIPRRKKLARQWRRIKARWQKAKRKIARWRKRIKARR